jgi:hypothetical protein
MPKRGPDQRALSRRSPKATRTRPYVFFDAVLALVIVLAEAPHVAQV